MDILRIVTFKEEFQVQETNLYARKSYKNVFKQWFPWIFLTHLRNFPNFYILMYWPPKD